MTIFMPRRSALIKYTIENFWQSQALFCVQREISSQENNLSMLVHRVYRYRYVEPKLVHLTSTYLTIVCLKLHGPVDACKKAAAQANFFLLLGGDHIPFWHGSRRKRRRRSNTCYLSCALALLAFSVVTSYFLSKINLHRILK